MKTKLLITLALLLNIFMVYSQNDEDLVKQIRQQFKTINDEIKTYTSESHDATVEESGADQTITVYYKENQIMKIEEKYLGDMAESTNSYYFWNNQLFFVYSTSTYHSFADGKEEATTNENRYYFNNNKLIRWLNSAKSQVSKNSPDYKLNEKNCLEQAQRFLEEYKK